MKYIADLHIHSPFSRATSKASHLHGLASWAAVKGIQVVGTGDFTHPAWFAQLLENLEEAEPGFFRLKSKIRQQQNGVLPDGLTADVSAIRFVLTSEISSIYKRGGRVRKVHNILFAPDLDSVRRINASLAGIGNIESDGRPILGLDSRDLLEIVLEQMPGGFLVPAHIWTPWFSLFGSKSGFDSIEECFGDLTGFIFALETGLSSDPDMNRMISALDRFTLISNSDCHSPGKLGREANIFSTGFDFFSMREALKNPVDGKGRQALTATVEFYPEEGKYHCDGHRKCGVCLEPVETREAGGCCPKCGKPLTVGVLNRVMEFADRTSPHYPQGSPGIHSLVPLPEILSEIIGTGPATKGVMKAYVQLINRLGSEFDILLDHDIEDLAVSASPVLAEAVKRVREGRVFRTPGYDGQFGVIRVFSEGERSTYGGQLNLFGTVSPRPVKKKRKRHPTGKTGPYIKKIKVAREVNELNPEQEKIVCSEAHHIIVKAGPGTGKTHTLVQRVIRIATQGKFCTVITFTNKAADELKARICSGDSAPPVFVSTLHGFCLRWLRLDNPDLNVAGPETRLWVLHSLDPGRSDKVVRQTEQVIASFLQEAPDIELNRPAEVAGYLDKLEAENLVDIDEVIPRTINFIRKNKLLAERIRRETGFLFVDEFQDLNKNQYELIRLLAATSSVFAIGDPDQAIYGFRGASPIWFSVFVKEMNPEQHVLFRNYRSGPVLVEAAAGVIRHNGDHADLDEQKSEVAHPARIYRHHSADPRSEAAFILGRIEFLLGGSSHREVERINGLAGNAALGDIAILYRTGKQAEILAAVLTEHGFPVQVVDLVPFFRSGSSYPLYCWALALPPLSEASSLYPILELEVGIGPELLQEFQQVTWGLKLTVSDLAAGLPGSCSSRLASILEKILLLREDYQKRAVNKGIDSALDMIVSHYEIEKEDPEVIRFFRLAENFGTSAEGFAHHLLRYSDSVVYDERAEAITLMTLHAAKGLQFPVVFVAGVEEGLLPLAFRKTDSDTVQQEHIKEERRLFYVGMTRAEEELYLTDCAKRFVHGELRAVNPSRFIGEIPDQCISPVSHDYQEKKGMKKKVRQLRLF